MIERGKLRRAFVERYGREGSLFRAPGRVNLIGEHTDYNDGFVFPMAIEPEIRFTIRARKDSKIKASSTLKPGAFVEFDLLSELTPNPEGKHWSNSLLGPAHFLKAAGVPLANAGLDILIDNTLPPGSGLSSSACRGSHRTRQPAGRQAP